MQTQPEVEQSAPPAIPWLGSCGRAGRMCRPQEAAHSCICLFCLLHACLEAWQVRVMA